ncbi:hypothetical protein ACFL20_12095, partial [Spirochaetota bacterium]
MKSKKIYILALTGIILPVIIIQAYNLYIEKAFWLDEWLVIYNLKFKTIKELFGPLSYWQYFPKLYLFIIKFFTSFFNFNYISLRIIPLTAQMLNIFLISFYLGKKIFDNSDLNYHYYKTVLLLIIYLSFPTTILYFMQVKHYSMESLCSTIAIIQYLNMYNYLKSNRPYSMRSFILIIPYLLIPFFSYNYPIVASINILLFIILGIKHLLEGDIKTSLKALLPVSFFILGIALVYLFDIRYVLLSSQAKTYWSKYIASYSNFDSFHANFKLSLNKFFTILFHFKHKFHLSIFGNTLESIFKLSFSILIFLGIIKTISKLYTLLNDCRNQKSFDHVDSSKEHIFHKADVINPENTCSIIDLIFLKSIDIYFMILLIITWVLYFLGILPIGPNRLNYFLAIPMIYFLINGTFLFNSNFSFTVPTLKCTLKLKYINYILIVITSVISVLIFTGAYYYESKGKNTIFSQQTYNIYKNALNEANKKNISNIIVSKKKHRLDSIIPDY